jgi:hypothetical protein
VFRGVWGPGRGQPSDHFFFFFFLKYIYDMIQSVTTLVLVSVMGRCIIFGRLSIGLHVGE